MSPGKKSPSSSPASSGLLQTRHDAVTPQPHHPVLDKAPEPPSRGSGDVLQTWQVLLWLLCRLPGGLGWPRAPAPGSLGDTPEPGGGKHGWVGSLSEHLPLAPISGLLSFCM